MIGEIPVAASVGKARVVSVAAMFLLGLGALAVAVGPAAFMGFLDANPDVAGLFNDRGTTIAMLVCFRLMGALSAVCALSGLVSLWRRPFT